MLSIGSRLNAARRCAPPILSRTSFAHSLTTRSRRLSPPSAGADPENLKWFVQAELMHCPLGMLGLAGMVGPGLLTKIGAADLPN